MTKTAVFTTKIESDLKEKFLALAAKNHCPASQIVRNYIRYIVENDEINIKSFSNPNVTTLETFKKSENRQELNYAKDFNDLINQLES